MLKLVIFGYIWKKLSGKVTPNSLNSMLGVLHDVTPRITPFLVADTQLYKRLGHWSIGPLVRKHESKSVKTHISALAHPSGTDGHVSGLVKTLYRSVNLAWPQRINSPCTILF